MLSPSEGDPEYDQEGAIMASLDPVHLDDHPKSLTNSQTSLGHQSNHSSNNFPDLLNSKEMTSLNLNAENRSTSFKLLDERENLLVESAEVFAKKLGCDLKAPQMKVLSIIGNTGEGKSHTLNHCLFEGKEVFTISAEQDSCTMGVWAAHQPLMQLLVLDTEGMLGQSVNENQRTRLLLKVLAISDIVLYQTRAGRLSNDLYRFLGDASKAFNEHFSRELKKVSGNSGSSSGLGPTIIICHETNFVNLLNESDADIPAEKILRNKFAEFNQDVSSFAQIRYIGSKLSTENASNSHYGKLYKLIRKELQDTRIRNSRSAELIFNTLEALSKKFSTDLPATNFRSFPDEYFTCQTSCNSCERRCNKAINHPDSHRSEEICIYQRRLDNKIYLCLKCYDNGRRQVVVLKASSAQDGAFFGLATFAWSGSVLECPTCGIIFKSREHWYGNAAPEISRTVHTEVEHIWPGTRTLQGTNNAGRRLLDGMSSLTSTVSTLSSSIPSKMVSNWLTDKIAPDYWRPNAEIDACRLCQKKFILLEDESIHHCRSCGEGFCGKCSDFKHPVPERGWGDEPVRVCHPCFDSFKSKTETTSNSARVLDISNGTSDSSGEIQARKYGETAISTLSGLASSVFDYPMSMIKESARPGYWVPDEEISECHVCASAFGLKLKLHHCRSCGNGVCDPCSKTGRPVPEKGWDTPVRVCDKCLGEKK